MLSELIQQEIFANVDWRKYKGFTVKCSPIFKEQFFDELTSKFNITATVEGMLTLERYKYHKYSKFQYPTGLLLEFETTVTSGYTLIPKTPYDELH